MSAASSASSASADARAARAALEDLLRDASEIHAGDLDPLERYVALLLERNATLNLTRVTAPADVARLHLLDALAALPLVDEVRPDRALDLGSGGGVPGIVLAVARPAVAWTLLDSVRKKVDALEGFAAALGLASVEAVAERAEVLGRQPDRRERYDLVTARACAALPALVEYALPLLRVGGTLLAWKGRVGADELADGAAAATVAGGGEPSVRATGIAALGDHCFVLVRKDRPTPDSLPRRPGRASRRPLGATSG